MIVYTETFHCSGKQTDGCSLRQQRILQTFTYLCKYLCRIYTQYDVVYMSYKVNIEIKVMITWFYEIGVPWSKSFCHNRTGQDLIHSIQTYKYHLYAL